MKPMEHSGEEVPEDFIHEITRAQASIAAYIRSLLPTHPDYMDVLQEVNVTLWRKQKSYEPGTNFKAWAFTVARFHVMSVRRKLATQGKHLLFSDELTEQLADAEVDRNEDGERRLAALRLCLGQLREKDRELIRVRYSEGMSLEDHARDHRRNAGTIRSTLRRLRDVLRRCINTRLSDYGLLPDGKSA